MENDASDDIVFNFDKFVENYDTRNPVPPVNESEQEKTYARKYVERYRELPQNRTRYNR
jgi:hypothetical protein